MAELIKKAEPSKSKGSEVFMKKALEPKNLKKIIIGLVILIILVIIIIVVLKFLVGDSRPSDAPLWYRNIKKISLTSYVNPSYGTFYCNTKVNLAYNNKDLIDEIELTSYELKKKTLEEVKRNTKVQNAIIDILSTQNYYKINTHEKRKFNLVPEMKKRLNQLFITSDGIVDISFPTFFIKLNNEPGYISNSYFEIGSFLIPIKLVEENIAGETWIKKSQIKIEIYIIYDANSEIFNTKLAAIKDKLKNNLDEILKKSIYDFGKKRRIFFGDDNKIKDERITAIIEKLKDKDIKKREAEREINIVFEKIVSDIKKEITRKSNISIIPLIEKEVKNSFKEINDEIKGTNKLFEVKDRFKDILISLFMPKHY